MSRSGYHFDASSDCVSEFYLGFFCGRLTIGLVFENKFGKAGSKGGDI